MKNVYDFIVSVREGEAYFACCSMKALQMGFTFIDASIVDAKYFVNAVSEIVAAIVGRDFDIFFMYEIVFEEIHEGTLLGRK
ncbi:hypothetical protein D3C86_2104600 [compost metagenome]